MSMKFYYGLLLAPLMFSGTAAKASNLDPQCTQGTLQSYEDLSDSTAGGCSVGILNYSGFSFSSTSGAAYDASSIEVSPTTGVINGVPLNGSGFTFCLTAGCPLTGTQFQVGADQTATYDIGYHFDIDSGPQANMASLGMDPPFGDVTINQYYCVDSSLYQDGTTTTPSCSANSNAGPLQTLTVTTIPPVLTTGIVPLNPPALNFADTLLMINLNGTGQQSGSGFTNVAAVTFVTPEPFTMVLAAGGLLVIALRKRYS